MSDVTLLTIPQPLAIWAMDAKVVHPDTVNNPIVLDLLAGWNAAEEGQVGFKPTFFFDEETEEWDYWAIGAAIWYDNNDEGEEDE